MKTTDILHCFERFCSIITANPMTSGCFHTLPADKWQLSIRMRLSDIFSDLIFLSVCNIRECSWSSVSGYHTHTSFLVLWYGEEVSHDAMAHLLFNGKNVKICQLFLYEIWNVCVSHVNCKLSFQEFSVINVNLTVMTSWQWTDLFLAEISE